MRLLRLKKAPKNRAGGEEEIRTLGTVTGTLAFQASPFDHSGTSPFFIQTTNLQVFSLFPKFHAKKILLNSHQQKKTLLIP